MDQINQYLVRRGHVPIAARTYRHYLKLHRYGYTRYLPINQLDIKTLQDAFWDEVGSDLDDAPVRILVHAPDQPGLTFKGIAVEASPSMALCRFEDPEAVGLLGDPAVQLVLNEHPITVRFPKTKQDFPARLESITLADGFVVGSFGFLTAAALELMTTRKPLPLAGLRLTYTPLTDSVSFSEITRKLYLLFQVTEAAKLICEELLEHVDRDKKFLLPSTRVTSIKMQSPLATDLQVGYVVAALIAAGALSIANRRRDKAAGKAAYDAKGQPVRMVMQIMQTEVSNSENAVKAIPERAADLYRTQLEPTLEQLLNDTAGRVEIHEQGRS